MMDAKTDSHRLVCTQCGATNRVPAARLVDDPDCGRCHQPLLTGEPVELSDANAAAVLAGTSLPVLIDFWAPWCGPCRQMAPQFEAAARQLKGRVLLAKVNSDDSPQLSAKYGIRSIPTLVKLQDGREVSRRSGALPAAQIVALAQA